MEDVKRISLICISPHRRVSSGPNPFSERAAADVFATLHRTPDPESNIISNSLDEEQERAILLEERARRHAAEIAKAKAHSEYRFTPLSVGGRLKRLRVAV